MNIGRIGAYGSVTTHTFGINRKTMPTASKAAQSEYDTWEGAEKATGSLSLFDNMMKTAHPEVQTAWQKAEEETGFNPLIDSEGRIVGSALLAKLIEIEWNLTQKYGPDIARQKVNTIMADKNSAYSLITAALERARNPLY